jgi:predicted phage terminase large subunit-like protein
MSEPIPVIDAAEELKKRRAARKTLLAFTQYTKEDYQVNWHHRIICEYLDQFVSGKIKRLLLSVPPRHGKSELVSRRLPAYILGRNPDINIISCSYSADLSSRMNRDVQRIIDSDSYKRLFPDTKLFGANVRTLANDTYLRNSDIFEIVGHTGVYRSAGVGGGITGMGAHIGIIDDPIKNREEAMSEVFREKVWDWYTSTFYTRLEKDGQILVTATRWHEDDLEGRIIEHAKDDLGDTWTVINFPAISDEIKHPLDPREPGIPLWPDKYTLERLEDIKRVLGGYGWSALYQGRPTPQSGEVIKRGWWKFYRQKPDMFEKLIQSWDFAFKDLDTSSRVCGQVWGRIGANCYLVDEVCDHMDFPASVKAVITLTAKHPRALKKLVEGKANGTAVIAVLKNKVPGLIEVEPEGGKVARAQAASPMIEAGNVFLPDPSIAPWIHDFIEECSAFPRGKFNDRVDSMSQALVRWAMSPLRNTANEPSAEEAIGSSGYSDDFGMGGDGNFFGDESMEFF